MIASGDDHALYLLEFATSSNIPSGRTRPLELIEEELKLYFEGRLKTFKTPLIFDGTPFQNSVWEKLKKIPYGKTWSYTDLAVAIGKPTACRAVAQANGANPFSIIVPCHRVINMNGSLGGYASGLERKTWLLSHEETYDKT